MDMCICASVPTCICHRECVSERYWVGEQLSGCVIERQITRGYVFFREEIQKASVVRISERERKTVRYCLRVVIERERGRQGESDIFSLSAIPGFEKR